MRSIIARKRELCICHIDMRSGKISRFCPAFARFMRIILGRDFLLAGMKSAGKNHPWKKFFIGGDEIRGEESSLEENFYSWG